MDRGFVPFEFDLPGALLEQLIVVLDDMYDERLTAAHVSQIPDAQGVYQLFLDGRLVYVGKTDAQAGLRKRLLRHATKILGRPSLLDHAVTYKAVQVLVFTAMDLETALIEHYKKSGAPPAWNGSSFGSNDPGRLRETTNKKPDGFDQSYPISIDQEDAFLAVGKYTVADALTCLKRELPYTLRYETDVRKGRSHSSWHHGDLQNATIEVSGKRHTVRSLLVQFVNALPGGWQATVFSSHVILYKETGTYTYGEAIRKPA